MKKLLLQIIFLFLILRQGVSQNINLERAYQEDYNTYLIGFIYDSTDQSYIIGGIYQDVSTGFFSRPYIAKIDSTGGLAWSFNPAIVINDEVSNIQNIVWSNDSNFIFSGNEMPICDVYGGLGHVQKLTPQGNIVWSKQFYSSNYQYFGTALCNLPSNSIRVSENNILYHLDSNGDSITNTTYFSRIRQITESPDHNLLLACDSALIKADTSGNVLHTLLINNVRNVVCTSSNEYYFSSGTTVYKTDSMLNITYQNNLQPFCVNINKVKLDQNSIWVLSKQINSNRSQITTLDDTLALLSNYSFANYNGSDFNAGEIIIHNNNYILAGHEVTSASSHGFIKSFNKTNNVSYNFNKDAGVISIRTDSIYAIPFGPQALHFYHVFFDVFVTVKNFGTVPLTGAFINFNAGLASLGGICLPVAYSQKFTGLNVPPGDSVELYIGWLSDDAIWSTPNHIYNLCLWTSSPDNKMDVDHTNDKICQDFTVTYIVGEEEILKQNQITLSPVPAHDVLNVNMTSPEKNIPFTIYDALGKNILEGILNPGNNGIPVNSFSNGLYFFKINSQKFSFAQKFVKQ